MLILISQLSPQSCPFLSHSLFKDYLGEPKRILVTATLQINTSPASWWWAGLGQECLTTPDSSSLGSQDLGEE